MLTLYSVVFTFTRRIGQLQTVLVSERNKSLAVKRARTFIATQYDDKLTLDDCQRICRTPDDVLEWA